MNFGVYRFCWWHSETETGMDAVLPDFCRLTWPFPDRKELSLCHLFLDTFKKKVWVGVTLGRCLASSGWQADEDVGLQNNVWHIYGLAYSELGSAFTLLVVWLPGCKCQWESSSPHLSVSTLLDLQNRGNSRERSGGRYVLIPMEEFSLWIRQEKHGQGPTEKRKKSYMAVQNLLFIWYRGIRYDAKE